MSTPESPVRSFLALAPPSALATALAERVGKALGDAPGLRQVVPADLHVTLVFLGDWEGARLAALEAVLGEQLAGLPGPCLRVRGAGAFPDARRPRVLWLGLEEFPEARGLLADLQARVEAAARAQGWRPPRREESRPFHPHLTVARARGAPASAADAVQRLVACSWEGSWRVRSVELFESRRGSEPERYRVRASVALAAGPGDGELGESRAP